jgi:hypothetical protein
VFQDFPFPAVRALIPNLTQKDIEDVFEKYENR